MLETFPSFYKIWGHFWANKKPLRACWRHFRACTWKCRLFTKSLTPQNEFLVRDRPPITRVEQMQNVILHLLDPSYGGSISYQKFVFEEIDRKMSENVEK